MKTSGRIVMRLSGEDVGHTGFHAADVVRHPRQYLLLLRLGAKWAGEASDKVNLGENVSAISSGNFARGRFDLRSYRACSIPWHMSWKGASNRATEAKLEHWSTLPPLQRVELRVVLRPDEIQFWC